MKYLLPVLVGVVIAALVWQYRSGSMKFVDINSGLSLGSKAKAAGFLRGG